MNSDIYLSLIEMGSFVTEQSEGPMDTVASINNTPLLQAREMRQKLNNAAIALC